MEEREVSYNRAKALAAASCPASMSAFDPLLPSATGPVSTIRRH